MKIQALFYQNPAGILAALLLLIFSVFGFMSDNNWAAVAFFAAFVLVLVTDILYAALSLKATRKYVKKVKVRGVE